MKAKLTKEERAAIEEVKRVSADGDFNSKPIKSVIEMQRADNSNEKGSTYVKEPSKDDVIKKRFKRIEELQAFNKSEAGKAFFEKQKQETELIAEFMEALESELPDDETRKEWRETKACKTMEQAARNLKKRSYGAGFHDANIHFTELHKIQLKQAQQKTASAIISEVLKIMRNGQCFNDKIISIKNLKKIHLGG